MRELVTELKNKRIRIVFFEDSFHSGGVAAADFRLLGCVEGFWKLLDRRDRVVYCNPAQIRRVTVLSGSAEGETLTEMIP